MVLAVIRSHFSIISPSQMPRVTFWLERHLLVMARAGIFADSMRGAMRYKVSCAINCNKCE